MIRGRSSPRVTVAKNHSADEQDDHAEDQRRAPVALGLRRVPGRRGRWRARRRGRWWARRRRRLASCGPEGGPSTVGVFVVSSEPSMSSPMGACLVWSTSYEVMARARRKRGERGPHEGTFEMVPPKRNHPMGQGGPLGLSRPLVPAVVPLGWNHRQSADLRDVLPRVDLRRVDLPRVDHRDRVCRHRPRTCRLESPDPPVRRRADAREDGRGSEEAIGGQRLGHGGDRGRRRFGLLLAPRRRARDQGRHAVRRAVGFGLPRRGRRPPGGVPAAPRPAAHDPAAQDQLPRQRLGAALARGQGGHLAVRGGLAPAPGQARRLRRLRPVRRSHQRPRRHVLRRPDRDPPLVGRHVRPGPPPARHRHDPRPRHRGPRAGDGRRHQRARASRPSPSRRGSRTPAGRSST